MSEQPLSLSVGQFTGRAVPTLGCLAQVVPPLRDITRIELSAILKSMNLAGNSMTCEAAFMLQDLLGVSPVRPSVMMEASMIRAAFKTFKDFDWMHTALSNKATESSSVAYVCSMIPPGWDSPAFCSNL